MSHNFMGQGFGQGSVRWFLGSAWYPLESLSAFHLVCGLVWKVQDVFTHTSGALAWADGRLGSAGTVDWSSQTWPLQHANHFFKKCYDIVIMSLRSCSSMMPSAFTEVYGTVACTPPDYSAFSCFFIFWLYKSIFSCGLEQYICWIGNISLLRGLYLLCASCLAGHN